MDMLALVERAVLAPSSHNTQPWLFRIQGQRIDLFADRTRALPVNDPDDRELVISCGAALFTLIAAIAEAGGQARVTEWPDANDRDWLASIDIQAGDGDPLLARLAGQIGRRHTYRKVFEALPVDATTVAALAAAAASEGATLVVAQTQETRHALAALVARGDHLQWETPSWRRELALWMHPSRQRDGLATPGMPAALTRAVVRSFDMGDGVGARDLQLAEGSPLITVMGTPGDTPADWLRAGMALQRCLLTGCLDGLQASHLNQPIEVPELRGKLQALMPDAGVPQLLLRWGHVSGEGHPSARRRVADVLF